MPCKHPLRKSTPPRFLSPRGWPDSADVGAGVCLGGWHDPENSVLDPHARLFFPRNSHGGVISMPRHVDMGAGRLPVEHLGAPQDQRLPFYLEPCFGVPTMKSAASCGHWRTENPRSGFGVSLGTPRALTMWGPTNKSESSQCSQSSQIMTLGLLASSIHILWEKLN